MNVEAFKQEQCEDGACCLYLGCEDEHAHRISTKTSVGTKFWIEKKRLTSDLTERKKYIFFK